MGYAPAHASKSRGWFVKRAERHNADVSWVIRGLSFEVQPSQRLVILGESGSGKSTILKALLGLGVRTRGSIVLGDVDLLADRARLKAERGGGIGMAFQNASASFSPIRRVGAQILEVAATHRVASRGQITDEAHAMMEALGLPERAWQAYPGELSGGMAARMGLICALLPRPDVLLLDEPTAGVDEESAHAILHLVAGLEQAVIVVTHDLAVADQLGGKALMLRDGHSVESGSTRTLLSHPEDSYTRRFVEAYRAVHAGTQSPAENRGER